MKRNYEKPFIKDIRLRIVRSQNDKLESMKNYARKEFGLAFTKTTLIRIAITEFLNNIKTKEELKNLLKKYDQI